MRPLPPGAVAAGHFAVALDLSSLAAIAGIGDSAADVMLWLRHSRIAAAVAGVDCGCCGEVVLPWTNRGSTVAKPTEGEIVSFREILWASAMDERSTVHRLKRAGGPATK